MVPRRLCCTLFVLVWLVGAPALADYAAPRGGRERTGRSSTSVPVEAPQPIWRAFLGGLLGAGSPAYLDAGEDGTTDLLILAGGLLNAKRPSDIETWAAGAFDLRLLVGSFDLDGDGSLEVVAIGEGGRVVVVSARTGEVLFDESVVGGIGSGTRVRDLDGDGIVDLYVPGAGCGAGGNNDGVALSFASDVRNPDELWRLEPIVRDHDCGNYDVVVDLDGDGTQEIVALGISHAYAFDSTTGAFRFSSDDIGRTPFGLAQCTPSDVQGDGDEELVCLTNGSYPPATNARRAFLLDLDAGRDTIALRWTVDVADLALDRNQFVSDSVADLDGDGAPEVVHSFLDGASQTWTTWVRNAATGAPIASWDGAAVVGLLDLDSDGRLEVLVSDADGLEALRYDGDLQSLWRLEGLQLARVLDRSWLASTNLRDRIAEVDSASGPAFVLFEQSTGGAIASLRLVERSTTEPAEIGRYDAPAGTVITAFASLAESGDPDAVFVAATSESRLVTLDAELLATNRIDDPKFPVLGARHGGVTLLSFGYAGIPLGADVDGDGTTEVVLADVQNQESLVDASDASLTREPVPLWSVPRGGFATFYDLAGPGPELGSVVQSGDSLLAFDSTGAPLWENEILDGAAGDKFYLDLLSFPLGTVESVFFYRIPGGAGAMQGNVVSCEDGQLSWPDWAPIGLAGDGPRPAALADLDGDGQGEIVTSPGGATLAAYDASDGTVVQSRVGPGLLLPVVADLEEDGSPEILETGFITLSAVDASFSELWRVPGETSLRSYGALARCPTPTWVTGLADGPVLRAYDLTDGTLTVEAVLAAGERFDDLDAAAAAGVVTGSVRSVTIAPSAADATDEVALVGSSDGHLYAVGACDLELRWAVEMGGAVGTPITADTDGDGVGEIVVTAGDGYVYGLGIPRLAPAGAVLDVDPPNEIFVDIDEIDSFDTLYAVWEGLAGTRYQVSVVTSDLTPVTDGFLDVGETTEATVDGLDLRLGVRYIFAVRAVDGDEVSPESVSDGVVVVDRTPPEIELTAIPDRLLYGSGDESEIRVRATDRRGLAHVSVEILDAAGASLGLPIDEETTATSFDDTTVFSSLDDSGAARPLGTYEAIARAVDAAGGESTARVTIEITEEVTPSTRWSARGGGCDCRAGNSDSKSDLAWLLAIVLSFRRRRNARSIV